MLTTSPGKFLQNLALLVATLVIMLGLTELALRTLVQPSDDAYGVLFGRELPPLKLNWPARDAEGDWLDSGVVMVVDGTELSNGDMYGMHRPDPVLAYVPRESSISSAGWWQSNNLGARSRHDLARDVPAGQRRILVFGESFAQGSRLPQEQAWPNVINDRHPGLEVANFAVDGYGMGQALLRYRQIRPLLDYDAVVLMFVPEADLWRDINVARWGMVMPRFVIDDGALTLVAPPAGNPNARAAGSADCISEVLHEHLQQFDRFYLRASYCAPPLVGSSILYKMGVHAYSTARNRSLRSQLLDPASEAMQVSVAIFREMQHEVQSDGALFRLAILPGNQAWRSGKHARAWQEMISAVCEEGGISCIDLGKALYEVPEEQIDYAWDGSHYGPAMNQWIADAITTALEHQ